MLCTTGKEDDAVVFSIIPMDRYRYVIVSHENPDFIGREMIADIPRKSQVLFVERNYYNEHLASDGIPIDDEIFKDTIGDPSSYPTQSRMEQIMAEHCGQQFEVINYWVE